jgi:hypothetical protein
MFPRVALQAPVFARPVSRDPSLAAGATLDGMLLDASRGGVAFEVRAEVARGDLVELVVRAENGEPLLERYARVISCEPHPDNEFLLRCAFVEPTRDGAWMTALSAEASPA